MTLYRDLSDDDLARLGITRDDSNSAAEALENECGETYPTYVDAAGVRHESWDRVDLPEVSGV